MKKLLTLLVIILTSGAVSAQQHQMSKSYIPPDDSLVRKKLSNWQDLKFGLFMHWGTYSQWGVVESWSICPEDEGWTQRRGPYGASYNTYKTATKIYRPLLTQPNLIRRNG